MNIEKAIEHIRWKFENKWKPTESDVKAFNAILSYKQTQEDINLARNENLAKMWVNTFITFAWTKTYNAEQCIQEIDKILELSPYEWCLRLKEEIPMMRFNSVGNHKYPLEDAYNITKLRERNEKIINEFETELTEALKHEPKEEDIIRFISSQINRVINKYEK